MTSLQAKLTQNLAKRLGKNMGTPQQGFTLVELLVVVVIVGILSAVALPQFFTQTKKAAATALLESIRTNRHGVFLGNYQYQTLKKAIATADATSINNTVKNMIGIIREAVDEVQRDPNTQGKGAGEITLAEAVLIKRCQVLTDIEVDNIRESVAVNEADMNRVENALKVKDIKNPLLSIGKKTKD